MASGRDLDTVKLRDWLDAGYVMLVEGADPTARQLLDDLFASETDEALERNFAALKAESQYRDEQRAKVEREQRRKTGAPSHVRLVPQEAIDQAMADWSAEGLAKLTGKAAAGDEGEAAV